MESTIYEAIFFSGRPGHRSDPVLLLSSRQFYGVNLDKVTTCQDRSVFMFDFLVDNNMSKDLICTSTALIHAD